jgi:hypothetical protein
MSAPELEPLDADILALLDRAKPVVEMDVARKAAILADVTTRIGLPPPDGDGGDGGDGGPGTGGGGAVTGGASALGAKGAIALATTFAIGVAAGVAADRTLLPSNVAPTPIVAAAPSGSTHATPSAIASIVESPGVPVSALPTVSVPHAATEKVVETAPSAGGLAAERALLDVARSALARGEASEALAAADRHARGYPDGALVEEREAIAIKALMALGRREEARTRARELERKYPNSLVLRAVKSAVEGSP